MLSLNGNGSRDISTLTRIEFDSLSPDERFEILNIIKQECSNLYVSEKETRSLGLHHRANKFHKERLELQTLQERFNS